MLTLVTIYSTISTSFIECFRGSLVQISAASISTSGIHHASNYTQTRLAPFKIL